MSQAFSFPRFRRALQNDVLRVSRPLLFGTLALLGVTWLSYLLNFEPGKVTHDPKASQLLYALMLGCSGLLFSSSSFNDMHHPLERYHYLMLPVSNLERFLSRYLLTGPLLLLYVTVVFSIMDWTGNQVTALIKDVSEPLFAPFSEESLTTMRIFLLLQPVMFLGAICFRSYAWIKTTLSFLLVLVSVPAVIYVSMRIFYYDAFSWSKLEAVKNIRTGLVPLFEAHWMNVTVVVGFALWILYIAYRCLRAHEVQE